MEIPFAVLTQVVHVLEEQGISYVIVGSFASSMRGVYRATADIDLVADLKPENINSLVTALQDDYYLDAGVMREAVFMKKSFNIIHFDTAFKVDIFTLRTDPFNQQEFARRRLEPLSPESTQKIYVATAEDTILAKLRWYRKGNEVSQKQWADIKGIFNARRKDLDYNYLREWAEHIGVNDLLEKALAEHPTQ